MKRTERTARSAPSRPGLRTARTALVIVVLAAATLLLAGCAATRMAPHEPMGLDFLPERGEFVSVDGSRVAPEAILTLARDADYVLVGEGHRNPCDHEVQHLLVRELGKGGRPPAVGLEMVGTDLQPVLERFNRGELAARDLDKALDWRGNWGYPFALFAPLFEIAGEEGLPVAALNAPLRLVRKVGRGGLDSLTPEERALLPGEIVPPPAAEREELRAVFAMHEREGRAPGGLERFLLVQSLWDTVMAENAAALRARTGRPVVILAGAGHVERGWGIASRLRLLDPGAKILLLTPLRDTADFDPGDGDGFFYCPETFVSRMGMTLELREGRVVVAAVTRGGRAEAAGIRPGDALIGAQGLAVHGFPDLHRAGKRAHDRDEALVFVLLRRGEHLAVSLGKLGVSRQDGKE